MPEISYRNLLNLVIAGEDLTRQQAYDAFGRIMDGAWNEAQIAALLVALAAKGHCVDEIAGAAQAMREHVVPIDAGNLDVIDTCGTGGTGLSTLNVSTAAALVAAGAGVPVAKHGNKTNTRASGSADVLAAMGVNIEADQAACAHCLAEANICFCFAVRCHPAMKYAAGVRRALGVRTIFNVLGPLTNPAGARRQLMGVFEPELTETIAKVLASLGAVRAMVVHAHDGLDEISTTSATTISELAGGRVVTSTVEPEDFGIGPAKMEELLVESAEHSAEVIGRVLAGRKGRPRDIVVLNAAAAITVAGRADDIGAAVPLAEKSIDSGAAAAALDKLVEISNS